MCRNHHVEKRPESVADVEMKLKSPRRAAAHLRSADDRCGHPGWSSPAKDGALGLSDLEKLHARSRTAVIGVDHVRRKPPRQGRRTIAFSTINRSGIIRLWRHAAQNSWGLLAAISQLQPRVVHWPYPIYSRIRCE
jgi:hypothetical protein